MSDYTDTRIWRTTLAELPQDKHVETRERLRVAYRRFRDRSIQLAQEIPRDVADLTVHDITHIDALWETADIIVGEEIFFTPLEAFVLGGAFLIHDLGLGLAAYPEGVAELKRQTEWADHLRGAMRRFLGREPDPGELAEPPEAIVQDVKFSVLRNLHAKRAEKLVATEWRDKNSGTSFRLLDDPELQNAFGSMIGRIARSHWQPTEQLPRLFPKTNIGPPVGFPREWVIDPIKIALTLRLADAAHLDARRAPTFLKLLRRPSGPAALHWAFQEKLNQVRREGDRLIYTGRAFPRVDAQAWWLCFDTLRGVDDELRRADNLNADLKRVSFAARGVRNVEDPLRLKELIPTADWDPVDARVKVGHVASLISRMGGQELYGDDNSVPLRELIQNAADAVRARRILQERNANWGTVSLRLGEDSHGGWIEIEDTGVGMSTEVLTGPFLDFGNSFWNSAAAAVEFPSLLSRGFQSTGRYGIGFFSAFMWGERVRVTTRRYDESASDTRILEFEGGLETRPVLRPALVSERISEGGTRVRVWPSGVEDTRKPWITQVGQLPTWWWPVGNKLSPGVAAYWLCPMLDVDLYFDDGQTNEGILIAASDWKTMTGEDLLQRMIFAKARKSDSSFRRWGANVRSLYHKGMEIGRGCIVSENKSDGCVTIGGCRSKTNLAIAAFIAGESSRVSREEAGIRIEDEELARWATEQASLVRSVENDPGKLAECAAVIAFLGGEIGDLPIAEADGKWMSTESLANWAREKESVIVISFSDAEKLQQYHRGWIFYDNVAIEPRYPDNLVEAPLHRRIWSGATLRSTPEKKNIRRPIVVAVAQGWSFPAGELEVWSGNGFDVTNYGDSIDAEEIKRPETVSA
jgi:Histidine kinase-, DNA gyrase B-, and HSP90-like ATPase